MKRIAVFIIAFTCLVGAADFGHAATVTTNLTVSATVPGVCTISTSTVNFGVVPQLPTKTAGQGTVTVTCAAGSAWTVTLNSGQDPFGGSRSMSVGGVPKVSYELYKDAGFTQVWGDSGFAATYPAGSGVAGVGSGAAQVTTVFGQAGSQPMASPGNYTDIVVATVNF